MREFMDFLKMHDPGLKEEKNGDFAGLQRISDPEDGTALRTNLADQKTLKMLSMSMSVREVVREEERQQPATNRVYDHHQVMMTEAAHLRAKRRQKMRGQAQEKWMWKARKEERRQTQWILQGKYKSSLKPPSLLRGQ